MNDPLDADEDAAARALIGDPGGSSVEATEIFCGQCGVALAEGSHAECLRRAELEPPRFCTQCRRRMKVQVTPRGWSADCVEHGPLRG